MFPLYPNVLHGLVQVLVFARPLEHYTCASRYPTVHSSLAMTAYCLHLSKCSVAVALRTSSSSWSVADASSTSRVVSAFGVAFTVTNLTYSSTLRPCPTCFTVFGRSLDNESAMLFFPPPHVYYFKLVPLQEKDLPLYPCTWFGAGTIYHIQ